MVSKLDGDARGGAALSVRALTGKPILFASTGEKLEQFELFHPDRMAQRILGMGDVMSLIEAAEHQFDEDEARELERKLRRNEFGLDDFLGQLKMIRRMGPLSNLLGMIPGLAAVQPQQVDEREGPPGVLGGDLVRQRGGQLPPPRGGRPQRHPGRISDQVAAVPVAGPAGVDSRAEGADSSTARAQTLAVSWYSARPMRQPRRSVGARMLRSVRI